VGGGGITRGCWRLTSVFGVLKALQLKVEVSRSFPIFNGWGNPRALCLYRQPLRRSFSCRFRRRPRTAALIAYIATVPDSNPSFAHILAIPRLYGRLAARNRRISAGLSN
jgi:hypothetical protein